MAKVDVITFATLTKLINLNGLYLIGYGWLFGMCWSLHLNHFHETKLTRIVISDLDIILWRYIFA